MQIAQKQMLVDCDGVLYENRKRDEGVMESLLTRKILRSVHMHTIIDAAQLHDIQ